MHDISAFFLAKLHKIPLGLFLQPVEVLLKITAQPSDVSTAPSSFILSVNLLRVHSVPVSRSLMKMWNSIDPGVSPWVTPLVTCLQVDFVPLITTLWA